MISVVLGFRNRSDYRFENVMLSLSKQTKDFELIIVDFGSSEENYDKQLSIVSKYSFASSYRYYPQFKDKYFSLGWANNLGAFQAKGDVIFFVGSDTMISKNTIIAIDENFKLGSKFRIVAPPFVWAKYSIVDNVIKDYDKWLEKINEQELLALSKRIPHNIGHNFENPYVYGIHTHVFLCYAMQANLFKTIRGYDLRFYGPLSEEDDIKERTGRLSVKQETEYNALIYHQEHENDGMNKYKGTLVTSDLEKGIMSKKYEEFNSPEMIKARFDNSRPTVCNQDRELWDKFEYEVRNFQKIQDYGIYEKLSKDGGILNIGNNIILFLSDEKPDYTCLYVPKVDATPDKLKNIVKEFKESKY